RTAPVRTRTLFVVDASGSMAAQRRMAAAQGAVLALVTDPYQQRRNAGLIAFRGTRADLVLPLTRSADLAYARLRDLPTGGRTPLALALPLTHATPAPRIARAAPPRRRRPAFGAPARPAARRPHAAGAGAHSDARHARPLDSRRRLARRHRA